MRRWDITAYFIMRYFSQLSLCVIFALVFTSCATVNNKFYRGDLIGFSDKPTTSYTAERGAFMNLKPQSEPYNLLDNAAYNEMKTKIKSVPRGNNTTAYYAMELAAKRVKYVRKKIAKNDPATKYYIFLLTDGLDNASSQVAKNEKQILFDRTPEKYQKRVQKKLKSAMGLFHKNQFEVYPMLYVGKDLEETKTKNKMSEEAFRAYLEEEMKCFRFSSRGEEYAPELNLARDFNKIMAGLNKKFINSSYTFRVPKGYAGKQIRMNLTNEKKEKITITARVKKSILGYYLTDIQSSNGVTFEMNGKTKLAADKTYEKMDNVNAFFILDNLCLNGNPFYPHNTTIPQEYEARNGIWQTNSEYKEVTESAIDTYFVLVMDGSSSLGKAGFEEETKIALRIMDVLNMSGDKKSQSSKAKSKK